MLHNRVGYHCILLCNPVFYNDNRYLKLRSILNLQSTTITSMLQYRLHITTDLNTIEHNIKIKHQNNSPQTMDIPLFGNSDSQHNCNISLNLSRPLVSIQMEIDNRQKTIREGSLLLFPVLSVFSESVISIKKRINCWLIQHTSQLQIKRASWGCEAPKMADAVHTFRHISYGYEILSLCVALWYAWVSVLLGLYVNPAVTPLSAAGDWYLGHVGRHYVENDAIWS